jgi:hypothetical protein
MSFQRKEIYFFSSFSNLHQHGLAPISRTNNPHAKKYAQRAQLYLKFTRLRHLYFFIFVF